MEPFRGGGAASHVGGNVGEWRATTADLAITTKKLVIFRRRRSFFFVLHACHRVGMELRAGGENGRGFYYPHEREIFVKSQAESSADAAAVKTRPAAPRKLY